MASSLARWRGPAIIDLLGEGDARDEHVDLGDLEAKHPLDRLDDVVLDSLRDLQQADAGRHGHEDLEMDLALSVENHPHSAVRSLALDPVAEVPCAGLVKPGHALYLYSRHRPAAGDHLVGDPDAAYRRLLHLCPRSYLTAAAGPLGTSVRSWRSTPVSPDPGLDALHVCTAPGVDPDPVALADEERDLDAGARLQPGRLGYPGNGVSTHPGLGLGDLQLHGDRQLDADHAVLVAKKGDRVALLHEGEHVFDLGPVHGHLLVGAAVHEVKEVTLAVEVGRLRLLYPDHLELVTAPEAVLEHGAVADVAQLRLDDGARAGQLDVLHRDDGHELAVHFERGPYSKVIRLDQGGTPSPTGSPSVPAR